MYQDALNPHAMEETSATFLEIWLKLMRCGVGPTKIS
jgi:hypothetical protein